MAGEGCPGVLGVSGTSGSIGCSRSIGLGAWGVAASVGAATAATGSRTKRTLSSARACSSWLTGRMPNGIGRSFHVRTAFTPGTLAARDGSIERIRAWGWGLRSSLAKSMRGRNRSSANRVTPVTFAVASTLRSAFPTTRRAVGRSGGRAVCGSAVFPTAGPPDRLTVFLPDAIQGLRCRLRILAAQASGCQLDGFVDLDVAGAAAEVARQRLFDLVTRRTRARRQERLGGEEKRRCAIAALCRAQLGERFLERMERPTLRHALDRLDPVAGAGEAEHETGEDRYAIDEHGAGTALAQLAAVFRAREPQVLPQHLEQGLVRCEGDLDGFAIQLQRDLHLGIGHVFRNLMFGRLEICLNGLPSIAGA